MVLKATHTHKTENELSRKEENKQFNFEFDSLSKCLCVSCSAHRKLYAIVAFMLSYIVPMDEIK